jgi:hypothetical protein
MTKKSVDTDAIQMDHAQLFKELILLRNAVRYHRDQKGDERCHLDDDHLYEFLPEGKADMARVLPCNFLENCKHFFEKRQNVPYKSVADLYAGWDKDKPYLTPAKIKIIITLLKDASDMMNNSSCNDFDLENTDENWVVVQEYLAHYGEQNNPEHERAPLGKKLDLNDYMMCDYLVAELERML